MVRLMVFIRANISGLLTIDVKDILVSQEETRGVIHLEPIYVLSTSMWLVSGLREELHVLLVWFMRSHGKFLFLNKDSQ